MKKLVCVHLLFLLLIFMFITSVHASVTVQAVIDRDVYVVFNFETINETIYQAIRQEVKESTIPTIIKENLEQKNLNHVDFRIEPIISDDSTRSMRLAFYMFGSDILNFTVNTKSVTKTDHVRTDWRKFQVNLTNGFSLNFAEYFGEPVENWQRINYTLNGKTHLAYNYNFTDSDASDQSCYFILPAEATNVQAVEDTITFDLPLSFEESLLNSPFLSLGAIIVIIIAFSLYRKVRK